MKIESHILSIMHHAEFYPCPLGSSPFDLRFIYLLALLPSEKRYLHSNMNFIRVPKILRQDIFIQSNLRCDIIRKTVCCIVED